MNRTMSFKGFALIAGIILAVFLCLHTVLGGSLRQQAEQENALRVQLTRLEEENKNLNARLNAVDTEEYIMTSAVRDYSYVKRDAIRFEYVNPEAIYSYTADEWQILMDELID